MKRVLLTGMSGTGKSTLLRMVQGANTLCVDLDDGWITPDETGEPMICLDRVRALFAAQPGRHIVLAGCAVNQGLLRDELDAVILLTAPDDVMRRRILARHDNPFGKSEAEWRKILADKAEVEPLLRARCDKEINTDQPPETTLAQIREYLCD